ncbi:MAG TPA: HAD-IIIA family hydrolase [Acidimicrobiia bacterium]|nr:HAD-IIIA family hydrolase [Acidimicrobiia bacterium]
MPRIASFLDRDGVIAESRVHAGAPRPPESVDDVSIPDGVADALGLLRRDGYLLVVITNQPDVARGTTTRATVDAINDHLRDVLPIDAVYTCAHDGDTCECRKPRPGLLMEAARDHDIDLRRSWLVGDRWVDIAAGRAAGVRTVLLERDYSWSPTSQGPPPAGLRPDALGADLGACVAAITAAAAGP